jgi:DnaK suppressor protein
MDADRAALLRAERDRATKLLSELSGDFESLVAAALDVATDDEHDPEGAGIAFERQQIDAVLEMVRARVQALDIAIARLEADDQVEITCEVCGQPIAAERLEAQPSTTKCVVCASPPRRRLRG